MTLTRLPIDTAFITFLRNNLTRPSKVYYADYGDTDSGMPPADATIPYCCVYAIAGGELSGPPLTDPQADGQVLFQVSSVGGTSSQALNVDDEVRTLVCGRTATGSFTTALTISGMLVDDRAVVDGTAGTQEAGVSASGHPLWQTTTRFGITVRPA